MSFEQRYIGEILVRRGALEPDKLEDALETAQHALLVPEVHVAQPFVVVGGEQVRLAEASAAASGSKSRPVRPGKASPCV